MTITREIREKVIQLSKEGLGRNAIARLLTGQDLHISEGSVGNIIRAYREELLQSLQKESSYIDIVNTSQSSQVETDATISTVIDISNTGSPVSASGRPGVGLAATNVVIPRAGGPLSHLLNEDTTIAAACICYLFFLPVTNTIIAILKKYTILYRVEHQRN